MKINTILNKLSVLILLPAVVAYKFDPTLITYSHIVLLLVLINLTAPAYLVKKHFKLYFIFSSIFLITIVNTLYFETFGYHIIFSVLNIGAALSLYNTFKDNPIFTINCFFFLLSILLGYIFFNIEFLSINSNEIMAGSRNHMTITVGAIWSVVFLLFNKLTIQQNKHRLIFFTLSLLSTYVLLMNTGRTGFIVSVVILLSILTIFIKSKNVKYFVLRSYIVLAVLTFFYPLAKEYINESTAINRVIEQGSNDVRWKIIFNLINDTQAKNFIIGFEKDFTIANYYLSEHNSLVEAYVSAGFFGLLLLISFFILSTYKLVKSKNAAHLIVFSMLLSQCFFDTGTFFSPLTGLSIILFYITTIEKEVGFENKKQIAHSR